MSPLDPMPNVQAVIARNKAAERRSLANPALDCMPNVKRVLDAKTSEAFAAQVSEIDERLKDSGLSSDERDKLEMRRDKLVLAQGQAKAVGDVMPNVARAIDVRRSRDAAMEKGLTEEEPIEIQGVKGMQSKSFRKKFRNLPAYRRWMDTPEAEDYTVNYIQRA